MSELLFVLDPDTGEKRVLGNVPAPLRYSWPAFGDVPDTKLIPRDRWASLVPDDEGPGHPLLSDPHDQNGIGMCNCSATAGAMEDARLRQGLPLVRLSGGDLYRRICFNGRDSGSTLDYVYRDRPQGRGPVGRAIDANYLNAVGWRGIRQRKRHVEELLALANEPKPPQP